MRLRKDGQPWGKPASNGRAGMKAGARTKSGKPARKPGPSKGTFTPEKRRVPPDILEHVSKLWRSGFSTNQIVVQTAKKFGKGERHIRYVLSIYEASVQGEALALEQKETLLVSRLKTRCSFEYIYDVALSQSPPDLRSAIMAKDRIAVMDASYAPLKVEHSGTIEVTEEPKTPEDTQEMLRKWMIDDPKGFQRYLNAAGLVASSGPKAETPE